MASSMRRAAVSIGFVGLGRMGKPMAGHVASALKSRMDKVEASAAASRFQLLLHDSDAAAATDLARLHPSVATACSSVEQVAADADVVLLSLPTGAVVQDVVSKMSRHLRPGATVVDCSTAGLDAARAVAQRLQAQQVGFVDAPVTGLPERAEAGTLTVLAGCSGAQLAAVQDLLEAFASKVLHVGNAAGDGQKAKALNNILYNINVAAMAEMLPLARKAGLNLEEFIEAVNAGSGRSFGFQHFAPKVLRREFQAPEHGYPMGAAYKDFDTLFDIAAEVGAGPPPVASAARGTYRRAMESHLDKECKGAMVKYWERELDTECTSAGKQ
eukprot:TRINITY_DN31034_c0_g1_i2.p1 TRINITY_DN31034_c0_g1~~TRINITY_DN31034_c0_g1_i2.p1  ORF type:complete len:328 (-),score=82.82 TRINITY_DN31034_c0_g1_i2:217-1200(-)